MHFFVQMADGCGTVKSSDRSSIAAECSQIHCLQRQTSAASVKPKEQQQQWAGQHKVNTGMAKKQQQQQEGENIVALISTTTNKTGTKFHVAGFSTRHLQ